MPQDAITLLDEDHQRVEALFTEYLSTTAERNRKNDVAQIICMELTVHAQLEEELFYPALRQATGEDALVQDALAEHQQAKELIASIQGASDPDALVLELQRAVQQHVAEERARIFPRARSAGLDLAGLGAQLEQRKTQLIASLTHEA
jgi:iron-sulfur cluster repair protein YtfE (RIC family)